MTPTARTLRKLKQDGWTADRVDCNNGRYAHDFLGCIDVIALRGTEVIAIQVTSGSNLSKRVRKVTDAEGLGAMRDAGWTIQAWGWRKLAKDGWQPRVVDLS